MLPWSRGRGNSGFVVTVRRGMGPGGYRGGVYRVGNGRGYTGYPPSHTARGATQRSGPRNPLQGGGVGGVADVLGTAAGSAPRYHPAGPVGYQYPPCTWDP